MQMDPASPPAYPPSNRPKLQSTFASRESEYELDDNELDEEDADLSLGSQGLEVSPKMSIERDPNEADDSQDGPLLQGLLADGVNRGSVDAESGVLEPWTNKGSTLIAGIASKRRLELVMQKLMM